ncbi:chemotaxis protein CheW [Neobacillus vireti]|uniref:Chemotaxis protein CheW n=1 Tax=Neobacillus vireti LMG 21834 TaxID=1131730 RepID=A0AB94IME5_9BACI|nr:chemotaxis protein CheW [Neobacillus vireti]ETI68113.1 chemotaxis signal transduction protein: modulation of cheA activity in response to attractant [Neobacillus vireti LMG 21834]KLT19796.1 chemotaxis protein CheW [Neobacillus vireti]
MEMLKIVAFKLGDEEYGLDIDQVQSIERIEHITRVPNAPSYVKGVINLRGKVNPIIDLRSKLNLGVAQYTENTRVIIVKYEDIELGLIVDQTSDVIDIDPKAIEIISSDNFNADYFRGIAKVDGRLVILIKLAELMQTPTN